jgi:hypothetical protein
MANEQQLERWAQALVEASILGDTAACEKYGVTDRTLRNCRRRLSDMPRLRRLYEAKLSRVEAEFSDSLTTRPAVVAFRGRGPRAAPWRQKSRELADAAAAEIVAVAAHCGLPEVRAAERGHVLPSGRTISLFVAHRDGSYAICECLAGPSSYANDRVLGHLLFSFESVRMHYRVPAPSIRLRVLADRDASPLWNRVVANVGVEIRFCNVLDVVRARLSSRTSEGEQSSVGTYKDYE